MLKAILDFIPFVLGGVFAAVWVIALSNCTEKNICNKEDCKLCPFPCEYRD